MLLQNLNSILHSFKVSSELLNFSFYLFTFILFLKKKININNNIHKNKISKIVYLQDEHHILLYHTTENFTTTNS